MPGWEGFDVGRYFYERHGYPVFVDNDANLMALGEAWAGVAVAVSDFLWVKLGSGIGCGIMSAGRLLRGANGSAGDIGHIRVGVDETPCGCGSLGCLEAIAGGDALSARAELLATSGASPILARLQGEGRPLTPVDVAAAVAEGDRAAIELVRSAAAAIGSVLAGVVNFYNPELIVIGGVVARIGDLLLAAIRESVYRESLPLATRELAISGTALGGLTGVVGAAALVLAERFQFAPLVAAGGGR
jgi:predicted NBD/HSP70 family sugar kinase